MLVRTLLSRSRPIAAGLTLALTLTLSLGFAPARDEPLAIDLDLARAYFAQAKRLSDADGGALWGRKLDGPIFFVDPVTRTVVANQRDMDRSLRKTDGDVWVGRLPIKMNVGNTATKWSGLDWTMIMWPLPADEITRGALLTHECFHRIQPRLGLPLSVPDNNHLDTRDGRLWIRLEWRALGRALEDATPLASEALRDALVFRAYRHSLFEDGLKGERELELNEGLAEYTGIRLSGAGAEEQRWRAQNQLRSYDRMTPFVRTFAYASGPAYGLLLDVARPGWPRKMGRNSDYVKMLARAIEFRAPRELEAEALRRAGEGPYEYDVLARQETERDRERQERITAYHARFVSGPVLIIDLEESSRYQFNPHDVQALDGIGTVYGTLRLTSEWGVLAVTGGGALMREDNRGFRHVYVPAPREPDARPLQGEGWTLEFSRGWTIRPGRREGDFAVTRMRR